MSEKSLKEELLEIAKEEGLDIGEEALAGLAKGTFRILKHVILKSESKSDDLFLPLLEMLEPPALSLIDKLDGEDDEGR